MIKLIATDMDGTFLDSQKKFDPEFLSLFYKLKEKNIPFELHIFEKGEHGLALCDRTTSRKASHHNNHVIHWFELCEEWLSDYID